MTVIDDFKDMSDFQVTVKGNSISIEDTIQEKHIQYFHKLIY